MTEPTQGPTWELCANCGHPKNSHGSVGTIAYPRLNSPRCFATIDTRHVNTGGDTLTPCSCSGYRAEGEPIRVA